MLCFCSTCCSPCLPTALYTDIAPLRMFTKNSLCLILCPIHEWRITYLFIYLLTYLLTYLFTYYLFTYLFTYLINYLLTYLLTYLFTYLRTYLLTYVLTYLLTYLLSYLLIYLLTPLSRVLLENITLNFAASQEIARIYGTRKSLTVPTSARHLSLSWANSTQSPRPPPTSWRSVLILSSHLRI
jgi:predicted PurR-regulated permease PerM